MENAVDLLLIDKGRLGDDFLRLRTGVAGIALQKFSLYGIRVAVVLESARTQGGRFQEFLTESNRGKVFRSFPDLDAAKGWLVKD